MNSFAQNINYIAGLDNTYGSKVELYKNNLSLKNVEHDIELKFSYYNNDDKKIHSIIHSEPGVLVGGINDVLLAFKSIVESSITGSEFTCTVSSGVQNFVINNVVIVSIAIDSNNDTYKAYELELKITTAGAVTYDLFGEVSDTLKILPSLAMITSSYINAIANAYEMRDEIVNISNNIASVTAVGDSIDNVNITGTNITNVNLVGGDIANVNTVSTHISNVDTVSQSITDVNTVSSNIVDVGIASTNIASINTVANVKNIADIIRVADDLNSLDVNGIADITIVANDLVLGVDSNIIAVSDSIVDVNTVSDSIDNVNAVGANITDVGTVSTNIANVNITATDIASVNSVGSNIADVNIVSDGISNVNIVSSSIANVDTVATNITGLNSIASNMAEILSADENASTATAKASEASDSASSALVFKNAASVSADNALISANNADASEANALNSASAAAVKANESLVSANAAITQAEIATIKAVEASESAANALISENGALSSKNSAAISASTATTKAAEAAASSSNASSSASIAGASASEASSSASAALLYKNSANASEINAGLSETNAFSYKNSAYASATDAADSSNLATTKASDASASASIATTKAVEASESASSSAVSASVATTKANDASLSAASASASVNKAEKWATENEDIEIEVGEYSAKHWAMKAQGFAAGNAINIGYNNTDSGLVATNVQDAIDEIDGDLDALVSNVYTKTEVNTVLALKVSNSEKGTANGVATLDTNGKVVLTQIPDSVLGQLEYMGTLDFTTMPIATQKGQYWIASVSGNGYLVGDWAVWNGSSFDKVDNTDAVASVAGRTGAVVLTKADVGLASVDNTADNTKNVLSATKLATARTINGVAFDGSSNINIVDDSKLPLSGGTMSGAITSFRETKVALTGNEIDLNAGNLFTKTISANTAFTVTNIPISGQTGSFLLEITNGGNYAITWWSNIIWSNGILPILTANGKDILGFITYNGGNSWIGFILCKDAK